VSFMDSTREIVFALSPRAGWIARLKRFYELTVYDVIKFLERLCGSGKNDCSSVGGKIANYSI
jgi:hypothetical protein